MARRTSSAAAARDCSLLVVSLTERAVARILLRVVLTPATALSVASRYDWLLRRFV